MLGLGRAEGRAPGTEGTVSGVEIAWIRGVVESAWAAAANGQRLASLPSVRLGLMATGPARLHRRPLR